MAELRPNRLLDNIIKQSIFRARRDINQWRNALKRAENVEMPRRDLLYNIYNEIMLDAHLSSEIQKRINAVSGANFHLFEPNGDISDKTHLLRKTWFFRLIQYAMESIFWGHSLIQIDAIENGEIKQISLVNRFHVIPEMGIFLPSLDSDKGIFYREDKYYRWLIEIGDNEDLGLLNKAVPHTLYKRFAQSAWSEFCEIFGMPIRYGKTNTKDKASLDRMEAMLRDMGTAAYAVIDDQEEITFVESNKSNGDVYNGLIDRCNSEISKLINGAVIGEASQGGSRAKEEVGAEIANNITLADKQFIENFINSELKPKLIQLGYPFEGLSFAFDQEKDLKSLWMITQGVLAHYDIDENFIKETFGIPVTGKKNIDSNLNAKDNSFFD